MSDAESESPTRMGWPLPGENVVFFPDAAQRWEGLDPTENLYFDQGIPESGGNIFVRAQTLNDGVAIQRIGRAAAEEWLAAQGYARAEGSDATEFDSASWSKS